MIEPTKFIENVDRLKYLKILDLMRRATANGTHPEVAEAISKDWHPLVTIQPDGQIEFVIQRREEGR